MIQALIELLTTKPYFYIDLVVKKSVDNHTIDADTLFSHANYYNNEQFAYKVLKAVRIYLKLLQWQALNDDEQYQHITQMNSLKLGG